MTKTKRQLRAEAVERLNEVRYGGDAVEFCEALLGERWSGENLRERIADLLTDEELPEGDAIGLLRDFPRTHTVGYVPVGACKDRKMRDIEDLYIIADMVERDYVRRDDYDFTVDALKFMTAERDYWKGQVQLCLDAAYPPSHSPERRYAPGVMGYPDRDGCTTPSTLVSAVIDELKESEN